MNKITTISYGENATDIIESSSFRNISLTPLSDPDLAFTIIMPHNWSVALATRKDPLQTGSLLTLASITLSDEVGIQVLGTLLPWEIDLLDWLHHECDKVGVTLLSAEIGYLTSGQVVHAVGLADDGAYMRLMVQGNGSKVVLFVGRSPQHELRQVEEVIGLAANTFRFSEVVDQSSREPVTAYREPNGEFELLYPESWSANALSTGIELKTAVDLRLVSNSEIMAYLRIESDRRFEPNIENYSQLQQIAIEEIDESGITVNDMVMLTDQSEETDMKQWEGMCKLPSGDGYIRVAVINSMCKWYSVVLLTPAHEVDPESWMRGRGAYKLAVQSLVNTSHSGQSS